MSDIDNQSMSMEDPYDQREYAREYDYDSEYDSMSTASTRSTQSKKKKEHDQIMKRPGVYTLKKIINGKQHKIRLFPTRNSPGARMINAITGYPYYDDDNQQFPYRVGTKQEDDLFKVRMLDGSCGKGELLFYESPDQFERHQHCSLSDSVKKQWLEKNQQYRMQVSRERTRRQ